MQINTLNKMIDKAKSKNDGVFSYEGFLYRVKSKQLTHFTELGKVYQFCGNFATAIGKYEYKEGARTLLKLIKE